MLRPGCVFGALMPMSNGVNIGVGQVALCLQTGHVGAEPRKNMHVWTKSNMDDPLLDPIPSGKSVTEAAARLLRRDWTLGQASFDVHEAFSEKVLLAFQASGNSDRYKEHMTANAYVNRLRVNMSYLSIQLERGADQSVVPDPMFVHHAFEVKTSSQYPWNSDIAPDAIHRDAEWFTFQVSYHNTVLSHLLTCVRKAGKPLSCGRMRKPTCAGVFCEVKTCDATDGYNKILAAFDGVSYSRVEAPSPP